MLKCETSIKIYTYSSKIYEKNVSISSEIFSKIFEKNDILWGRKGPQCDHFRTSEKARCGADLAATGQCSPPLHNTVLQIRCRAPTWSIFMDLVHFFGQIHKKSIQLSPYFQNLVHKVHIFAVA